MVGVSAYRGSMSRREPDAFRITSAPRSHSDEVGARQKRYLISMGIRTACFVLAIVFRGHWFMWAFIIASFILPYIAVVMANAGSSPDPEPLDPIGPDPTKRGLEGGRSG